MDRSIRVLLLEDGGVDYIRFFLDENEIVNINLNSNDQSSLRNIYKKMIAMSMSDKLKLELDYQEGYDKLLFKEIAEEFIKDLNVELDRIHEDTTVSGL